MLGTAANGLLLLLAVGPETVLGPVTPYREQELSVNPPVLAQAPQASRLADGASENGDGLVTGPIALEPTSGTLIAARSLAVGALVGGVAAATVWLTSVADGQKLSMALDANGQLATTSPEMLRLQQSLDVRGKVTMGLLIGTGVAGVGSLVLFLLSGRSGDSSLSVVPWIGPGAVGGMLAIR